VKLLYLLPVAWQRHLSNRIRYHIDFRVTDDSVEVLAF
ncbi:MAG: hypothetical protein CFH39_02131, partial [Alphaproteobacteria bacterium MarineAlpha10_Bin2]